jgi:yeast amino acid transporter
LIVISGTIGMGLFKNSGEILAIAGPGGGITAFAVVGVGVMMVMEGLAEMVTHWPISNAMIEFVRVFIDKELAIVIGVAYASGHLGIQSPQSLLILCRYAYSISFTTLIIAAGDLASNWEWSTAIQDATFIVIVPLFLLILNCFGVAVSGLPLPFYTHCLLTCIKYYGNVEALCGILKIGLVLTAFVTMIILNHLGACVKRTYQFIPVLLMYLLK